MYETSADVHRQVLNIKLAGFLTPEEADEASAAVISKAAELDPGFTVITDISEFKPARTQESLEIQSVMQFLAQKGLKRAFVVTGGKALGRLQFDRLRGAAEAPYEVFYVENRAEAMKQIGGRRGGAEE